MLSYSSKKLYAMCWHPYPETLSVISNITALSLPDFKWGEVPSQTAAKMLQNLAGDKKTILKSKLLNKQKGRNKEDLKLNKAEDVGSL